MNETKSTPEVNNKKKETGIIRWNAILPLTLLIASIGIYFQFFFDSHMKSALEWVGFKALGAEVNITAFKSSLIKGKVEINGIQLTNKENPKYNSIELQHTNFDLNMDALLRMKAVIENIAIEGVQFQSLRKKPGKVAPPEPISTEPSLTDQLKGKALNKLESENQDNLIGDIAEFIKNGDINSQLKNFEDLIVSKKMAEDLNKKWGTKKEEWDQKIKNLPNKDDLDTLKSRFSKIKYKDFKSPEELSESIKEFNSIKSAIDEKVKLINETKNSLTADVNSIQKDYKNLENQIKSDIDLVKTRFKIPKIDAAQFTKTLFMGYLTPYTDKLDQYKKMAQKYLPPKYAKMIDKKKGDSSASEIDDSIQPLPREKGVSYEFPMTKGYPLLWIQRISLSSKSNAQVDYGDISGEIKNITSNQRQINKLTDLNIQGDFKSQNLYGLKIYASLDNLKTDPVVKFNFDVASYLINNLELIKNKDIDINLPRSQNSISVTGSTVGFKKYDIDFKNYFKNVNFNVDAENKTVNEVINQTFSKINEFDLQASAKGEIKNLDISIRSSLGGKLEDAFNSFLQKKLEEVNKQVKIKIDEEVNKQKEQLNKKISELTKGHITQISQIESQLNDQRKLADDRIQSAKKDLENKAKSKLEDEGKKAIDGLKKKFGF